MTTENTKPLNLQDNLGIRLKKKREELGILQPELARMTAMDVNEIKDYEAGLCGVPFGKLFRICKALKVEPAWVFQGHLQSSQTEKVVADDGKAIYFNPPLQSNIQ